MHQRNSLPLPLPALQNEEEEEDSLEGEKEDDKAEDRWRVSVVYNYFSRKSSQCIGREYEWLSSFYRSDPRWQIMHYFDEVATKGRAPTRRGSGVGTITATRLLRKKTDIFTVWRPTSNEAIRKMMLGVATGKGMNVKGKSARSGNISSYIPFVQVYEDGHMEKVQTYLKDDGIVRVYYGDVAGRDKAMEFLRVMKCSMLLAAKDAQQKLAIAAVNSRRKTSVTPAELDRALQRRVHNEYNLRVTALDDYAPEFYGLDITERLFWEAYVMQQDCSRPEGTEWHIDRGSNVHSMDQNLMATRKEPRPGEQRVVVYQQQKTSDPMEPRTLLVAYEENGTVLPVVSDFDCFLIGSRGMNYGRRLPEDQLELLQWLVRNIDELLRERKVLGRGKRWSDVWVDVIKRSALLDGYYPVTPRYGNGDPTSYTVVERAAERLKKTGCVRHGPECFNWVCPQEMDEHFLVICDALPGNVPWKYMNLRQLQDLLISMIDDGFTFPINPKWILCDPGWKKVYNKLRASNKPNVQESLDCWFPPGTGIREEIDRISMEYPRGLNQGSEAASGAANCECDGDGEDSFHEKRRQTTKPTLCKEEVDLIFMQKIRSELASVKSVEDSNGGVRTSGRGKLWLSSFYRSDPRWQIMRCFAEVIAAKGRQEGLLRNPKYFTVWRPSASPEGIRNMMLGIAVGKGLDIKSKSARGGNISSFVPFIQIYEEKQKEVVWNYLYDDQVFRIFYPNKASRNEAIDHLLVMKKHMLYAMHVLNDENSTPYEHDLLTGNRVCNNTDLEIILVDDYAPKVYGLDIPEKLFWEAYVMQQDCSRPEGTDWDINLPSNLFDMDQNFATLRRHPKSGEPRVVVYQMNPCSPTEPRTLLMAYEEHGSVKPVVCDFDCLLSGSRGLQYDTEIPKEQVKLMQWFVKNIGEVLEAQKSSGQVNGWTESWIDTLKTADIDFRKIMQRYGFGDPKSYNVIECAIERLQSTGCVRHGAECFNWGFPQEMDDHFLVICDALPGNVPWKYMNLRQLQDLLISMIDDGFTFPINPKWILCDPGWKKVYNKLRASNKPNVQESLDCWFPPETGIREEIDRISMEYPDGWNEDENNTPNLITSKGHKSLMNVLI